MHFFDSHAHLDRASIADPQLRQIHLRRAQQAGVRAVMIPAVDARNWSKIAEFAEFNGVELYYSLGIHPYAVAESGNDAAQKVADFEPAFRVLKGAAAAPPEKMKAVGECGLHFARGTSAGDKTLQEQVFRRQLDLARRYGLPLIIHCVGAHQRVFDLLREAPTPPSVLHSYSGSAEMGLQLCRQGHFLSFSGAITMPRARRVKEVARRVPPSHMLIETDSPDQTPAARRPAANEPSFIVDVAEALARLRGVSIDEIAERSFDNACRVFGI